MLGATTGKESAIGMPDNFIPMGVTPVTTAATNAVNLNDIGTDADTDGFVDGITCWLTQQVSKDSFLAIIFEMSGGLLNQGATADEVEVVLSGDPGATGATIVMKFIGVSSSADAS